MFTLCVVSVQDVPPDAVVQVSAVDAPLSRKVTWSVAPAPKAALRLTARLEIVSAAGAATSAVDSEVAVKPPPTGGAYCVVLEIKVNGVPDHPDIPPPESEPHVEPASMSVSTPPDRDH
jgi:hypothetical protein